MAVLAYARAIKSTPLPFLLVIPILLAILIGVGLQQVVVENKIYNIWVPMESPYAKDVSYRDSVAVDMSNSLFLAISKPRDQKNALQSDMVLEMAERLEYAQSTTVTVDDMVFTWDDVCYNAVAPYLYPCFRMTVLDCFAEGGYDFSATAQALWQANVETGVTMSYSSSVCAEYCSPYCALCDGATVTANCTYTCAEASCDQCIDGIVASLTDTQSTQLYYGALAVQFAAYPMDATCLTNPTTAQCTATLDAYVLIGGGFDGKTPYTFQTNPDVFGMPRPSANGSDESAVLAAASGTCYNWDGGQALPATNPILTYSSPPNGLQPEDFSPTQPLEFVSAFQHLYQILRPEMVVERVTNAYRPSGSISLTTKQAADVIYKFKKAFEKNMAKDWDKESSGKMYHTAFADDSGAIGTFGRMLSDVTLESVPLSIVCCASLHSRLADNKYWTAAAPHLCLGSNIVLLVARQMRSRSCSRSSSCSRAILSAARLCSQRAALCSRSCPSSPRLGLQRSLGFASTSCICGRYVDVAG